MTHCNSEGVAKFIRFVEGLSDFTEDMSDYEVRFMYDSTDRIKKFEQKTCVTVAHPEFAKKFHSRCWEGQP